MKEVSRYAAKHGVIVRNKDVSLGTKDPYALHNVDMYDDDVPVFGYQPFTIGSNTVDFMSSSTKRTVHEMEPAPIYFNASATLENDFYLGSLAMHNYRKVDEFSPDAVRSEETRAVPENLAVLMVMELEQVASEKLTTKHISKALAAADISVSKTEMWQTGGDSTMYFLAEEGYVIARAFPQEQYCALDVMLWGSYDKIYSVEKQLTLALDSGIKSSYRIVKSGITGRENLTRGGGEHKKEEASSEDGECKDETEASIVDPLPIGAPHVSATMNSILSSMATPPGPQSSEMLVLCGEKSMPCEALKVATNYSSSSSSTPTTIYACPESELIYTCESKMRSLIHDMIKKISVILIDASTPQSSGENLFRILDNAKLRDEVLSETVVVLAGVVIDQRKIPPWFRNLMEIARTDFFPFNPSFQAEVIFRPPLVDNVSNSIGFDIYSAGNPNFYTDFVQAVGRAVNKTGLSPDVRTVKNGLNNYIVDFEPAHPFSPGSYDNSEAREQRKSSKPYGRQSIWQYEAKAGTTEYTVSSITSGLKTILTLMDVETGKYEMNNTQIGAGFVILALWDGGDVTISYDGKSSLDVNLFTLDRKEDVHVKFEGLVRENIPSLVMNLGDMQPRGTGKVVCFDSTFDSDHYYQKMKKSRGEARVLAEDVVKDETHESTLLEQYYQYLIVFGIATLFLAYFL